jgi:23S rRNA (cytidine1920-2'-O)/16S rRNA (cytidine1409-2'-O)-methyltransferase
MHYSLREDPRVELHEKTDIRDFAKLPHEKIDIAVCDVSFISLTLVVPSILKLTTPSSRLLLMCKPQFEAGREHINKGVVKNEAVRRRILSDFESWLKKHAVVLDKADSDTPGEKGNVERFFLVKKSTR